VQGGSKVSPEEMGNAIDRIKVLGAYLDEVGRYGGGGGGRRTGYSDNGGRKQVKEVGRRERERREGWSGKIRKRILF